MDSEVRGKHVGEDIKNDFTLCLRMCISVKTFCVSITTVPTYDPDV